MTLITVEEAAAEFRVHRTTLYRALKDERLQRYSQSGSRHTWLDRSEVRALLVPARLTEDEVLDAAKEVVDQLVEDFTDTLEDPGSEHPAFIATLRGCVARFLDHYGLRPGLSFSAETEVAMMYGRGPGYSNRPSLAIRGTAESTGDSRPWTFSLFIELADELNAVRPGVGTVSGVASAKKFDSEPRWILALRQVRIKDPAGGGGWVPATALAFNRDTHEIQVTLAKRMTFAPGQVPPSLQRLTVPSSAYVIEDEPFPGVIIPG